MSCGMGTDVAAMTASPAALARKHHSWSIWSMNSSSHIPPTASIAARGIIIPDEMIVATSARSASRTPPVIVAASVRASGILRSTGTGPMHPSRRPDASTRDASASSRVAMSGAGRVS